MPPNNPNLATDSAIAESTPEISKLNNPMISSKESKKRELDEKLGHQRRRNSPTANSEEESSSGRERLKRYRVDVAGRVWIPDLWGQEDFLKDWVDCTVFDAALRNNGIISARASLMEKTTPPNPC